MTHLYDTVFIKINFLILDHTLDCNLVCKWLKNEIMVNSANPKNKIECKKKKNKGPVSQRVNK